MKSVNLDIEPLVQLIANVKLPKEEYINLQSRPGVMLARFKHSRIKQFVQDARGNEVEVKMSVIDLIKHKHGVAAATARQAILNMERGD